MPRYLHNALVLLAWAVALPFVIGMLARVFVFRRDEDDIVRHEDVHATRMARTEASLIDALKPEPGPLYQEPWPDFKATTRPPTTQSPAVSVQISRNVGVTAAEPITYRGFRHDVQDVRAEIEKAWRVFIANPHKPQQWQRYSEWGTDAPYALGGAAGDSVESATLTVSPEPVSGVDPAELMEIWNAEILPELEARYGTRSFRRGTAS
jgi:hypothetical protein